MAFSVMRHLPFAPSATPLQAATYLLGISLFSISFLVFLNSSISFVITDRIGVKKGVGDIVGTLGFVDELVALVACPVWGLVSDRLGVRLVAVIGYTVIALALVLSVQAVNVYPQLLLARILFAVGATAAATMVTAILPSLTDESEGAARAGDDSGPDSALAKSDQRNNPRDSALSLESQLTITPERFVESQLRQRGSRSPDIDGSGVAVVHNIDNIDSVDSVDSIGKSKDAAGKPSKLAGFVGLFTGCGALVALVLFLPLPAEFGRIDGITMAEAVAHSFYIVAIVALCVAVFVFIGLRNLRGENGKGWRMLLGRPVSHTSTAAASDSSVVATPASRGAGLVSIDEMLSSQSSDTTAASPPASSSPSSSAPHKALPYWRLLRDSVHLGFTDADIALGYLGGFVARASTVAISLFVPLFVNSFFIGHGFCQGDPHDSSPELKKECRAAYVLASIITGVAQLMGLLCAPLFGYLSSRPDRINVPIVVATTFGIVGYTVFPLLASPEPKNVDGRGGSPAIFAVATLIGISQIGAIVCSLGSLGRGVLAADGGKQEQPPAANGAAAVQDAAANEDADAPEGAPLLLGSSHADVDEEAAATSAPAAAVSRIRLKGSIAGVYSWCGGAAILLLTKLGGFLFDNLSTGAPFYMMAVFNAALLVASLAIDASVNLRRLRI